MTRLDATGANQPNGSITGGRASIPAAGAELASRAIAAVEQVDARFFEPVALNDVMVLLGRLAQPES